MQATCRAVLNLNSLLTPTASTEHIFPHLQSGSFISIGKLCDDVCMATFTATHLNLVKGVMTILECTHSNTSSMWQVNLTSSSDHPPSQPQPGALNAPVARIKPDIVQWYHATLFSPVVKTLLQYIKKFHFSTWPNLTVDLMKHIP